MHPQTPRAIKSPTVANIVTVADRRYEQRFQQCHKINCSVCNGTISPNDQPQGHGPYWYLCFTLKGEWKRIYIGKNLDTQKFINADGSLDFAAIEARRTARQGPAEPLPLTATTQ